MGWRALDAKPEASSWSRASVQTCSRDPVGHFGALHSAQPVEFLNGDPSLATKRAPSSKRHHRTSDWRLEHSSSHPCTSRIALASVELTSRLSLTSQPTWQLPSSDAPPSRRADQDQKA